MSARPELTLIAHPLGGFDGELTPDNLRTLVETVEDQHRQLAKAHSELAHNEDEIAGLNTEIRSLAAKLTVARRNADAERQADPQRPEIIEVIEAWKRATGHPRSNAESADRFDLVKARLREGYTPEHLILACEGIGAYPFVVAAERRATGTPAQLHDRLGIALGSGEALERFANLGHQARKAAA